MTNQTRNILLGLTGFILINVFEAAQQHYYITRFQLSQETVSFWYLLKNHSFRWLIWLLTASVLYYYSTKNTINKNNFSLKVISKYLGIIALLLTCTLILITFLQIVQDGIPNNLGDFWEYFLFYVYQKSALFSSAYIGLAILVHLHLHRQQLDMKIVELSGLKKEYNQLYQELKTQAYHDTEPIIHVKIGNKMKAIPLAEIQWIQSEDYCVRIHVQGEMSYLLRKSMKAMEVELAPKGFLRIHRHTLVNTLHIDAFQFSTSPEVSLRQGPALKIAQSRVPQIREVLKQV